MSVLEAIFLAVIEGITEFLPVSSTGHMIIASAIVGLKSDPFTKTFIVAIQFGAILSVIVLYWKRFFKSFDFYFKLFVGFIPAAVIGFLLNDVIDNFLERVDVVAISLIVGGILFLFLDKIFKHTIEDGESNIGYGRAFKIGVFQIVAMIPGVSRSAATIIGGLTQKLNKRTAAEFSFFLAVPTMFGATVFKLYKYYVGGNTLGTEEIQLLLIGNIVAFIIALFAIRSFIQFLTKNGFKIFGYYRIALGTIILILYLLGSDLSIV